MSEEINAVELRLEQWLHPVTPDEKFVERLRTRLTTEPRVVYEAPKRRRTFARIIAGVLMAVVIVRIIQHYYRKTN